MASKTLLVAFFLVSLSLLALSPSVSSERDHHKECKQRCRRDYPHDERERWMCERRCQEAGQEEDSRAEIWLPERDPRKECEHQCERQGAGRSEKWREACRRRCEEEAAGGSSRPNPERECRERCRREGAGRSERWQERCRRRCEEEAAGGGADPIWRNPHRECWERCRRECHDEKELRRCERMCEEEAERERRGLELGNTKDPKRECERICGRDEQCRRECEREHSREKHEDPIWQEGEGEGKKEKRENPYIWTKGEFQTKYKSEAGSCETLPNFAEKSNILKGLENYRVEKFVANPSTVVVPHYKDADSIIYVCNGRGIIGALDEEKQETFEVSEGDVMVVPAGTTCFVANTDEREQLCMINLLHTVSIPGKVETRTDHLKRLFSGRRQVMVKASKEQIRELSRSTSDIWPVANDRENCHRPYNVLKKKPWFANRRGRIYRVDPNEYAPLHRHDIAVNVFNISGGSMIVPGINSRAITIAFVLKGSGYIEMACPHLSSQQKGEQERQGARYHKVSAELRPSTVSIEPAGHPSAVVANEDLHVVCFDINVRGNHKYALAGKNNIYSHLKGVAGELAFGTPTKECERVLGAQQEEILVAGPKERREGGGRSRGYEVA
ncbi:vicilin Jug r 6.0101-like isoform X2 [Nymphaea colorata]|uniref:vicilin Jug r 6.0101-like isoform X2 n=1 Tax=Nymphaea colorata TaxID=210225 RepID=UPI00129E6467|nr:vicilin Jug r 6.0101-like isoform X2 [Nymphaea colorata]